MTISRREVGFNERDMRIAIGLGAGLTADQIAAAMDVDRSTVFNRKAANRDFINFWTEVAKGAVAASIAKATEDIKAKYERMYDKAIRNLDEFLEHDDDEYRWRATKDAIDRVEGKATQRIKQEIESHHTEERVVSLQAGQIQELLSLISGSRALLGAPAPATPIDDYQDAELVAAD